MKTNQNIHRYFYFSVLALIGLLYFPRTADFGLFMDGSIYGTIAHNMAIGDGSFWRPMFHNAYALKVDYSPVFHEHPPLMFWMESVLFKIFGDGFYVENIYNTLILIAHILILTLFFRSITEHKYSIFAAWPVLLLWYSVPTVLWSSPQNMIENSLSLWGLLSVWAAYKAVRKDHFLWAILAGLFMGLGVLTKGPMGLFSLTSIALLWLASLLTRPKGSYSFSRAFYKSVAIVGGFLIVALNVYIYKPARIFMTKYIKQQVIPSIKGEREMPNTLAEHFSIVRDMLVELAPIYGVAILLFIFIRSTRKNEHNIKNRLTFALWFLFVGLSATLPIILSAKSHSFYVVSSIPYFALAVVLYWIRDIHTLAQKIDLSVRKKRIWKSLVGAIVVFTLVSTVTQWGAYKRDGVFLSDMDTLSEIVNPMTTVGVDSKLNEWATLHSNLERHKLIYTNPDWIQEKVVLISPDAGQSRLDSLEELGFKLEEGNWRAFFVYKR